jgi:hypothetical protein
MSTATGTLRKHLSTCHYDMWISECKRHKIPIKLPAGLENAGGEDSEAQAPSHPSYSPELFMNALVNFIVTTDQVFFSL